MNLLNAAIEMQYDAMKFLNIEQNVCDAASALQRLQFLAVTMGLRAELLHGEGLLHWVSLAAITQALTTAKRTVRLHNGSRTIYPASCNVQLLNNHTPVQDEGNNKNTDGASATNVLPDSSINLLRNGIPEAAVQSAFEQLFDTVTIAEQTKWAFTSGRTPFWKEQG